MDFGERASWETRGSTANLVAGFAAGLLLASNLIRPMPARAQSLTDQLHMPPQSTFRQQRDVADEFLLLGQRKRLSGEFESSIVALNKAADVYHYLGDLVGMGEAYKQLVQIYSSLGQYREAELIVRRQLAIARTNQNFSEQVLALNNLGTLSLQTDDLGTAYASFSEGLQVAQSVDSDRGIGLSLSNLGLIAAARGLENDAQKYYETAATYRARARDYAGQANTDSNLGDIYLKTGQLMRAIGAYRMSLIMARQVDDPYLQLRAIDGLIRIYRDRNEPHMLTEYLDNRIALTIQTGDDWQRLMTLKTMAEIKQEAGEWAAAQDLFGRALTLAVTLNRKQVQAELTNRLRWLALQM
ncbi:tetratricopeptide repeat protein [cf. Phormidesmis sp. LEGE 11477]|uniref:tetratricopeptide repeat protein n=1 Tax=cf. Phormidesmis sp. LEGE 11477 TaxID=1828680 RepID=UPI00187E8BF5|nr:tetratricopeptide repeat protein [cf. Phormidesmis sp. LEGE 11477]MBE9062780.1 tetratricopeptide repeat protein [cf. Phormidesmis sp. LEGE 11477]